MSIKKHTIPENTNSRPVYLDCNATTPMEPEVCELVSYYMDEEFGNAGSRTHDFGATAKRALENARQHVADLVEARREEVIFVSGATESCNLAILGLEAYAKEAGKRHIVTSAIEHHAVLEPFAELERRGFEVTLLPCGRNGRIDPDDLEQALRARHALGFP